ncbi:hypothetical protein KKD34_05715 [bacterium]|nr:hypothetical protein [bacterium]
MIHNGIQAEDAFSAIPGVTLIRSIRALPFAILRYDVLIVPTHTDQAMLYRLKGSFIRYLGLGGVLVLLGATTQGRRWLPRFQWEQKFTQSIHFDTSTEDGQRIFKGVPDPQYLQYHSKYVGHGSITVSIPQGDQALAGDDEDRKVVVLRRLPEGGVLLVTTLDPDYHASAPVPGPAEENVETTHRKAGHLLENIVNWAIWAAQNTPKHRRRRLLGFVLPAVSMGGMAVFYLLPVAVFMLLFDPSMAQGVGAVGRFVAAIAFLGSLVSIYTVFRSFISKRAK